MTKTGRIFLIALIAVVCVGSLAVIGFVGHQTWTKFTQPAPQVALTQDKIDGLIAVEREVADLSKKMPSGDTGLVQGARQAFHIARRMSDVGKRHGFADLDEFRSVAESWQLVQTGIDPKTRTYVGPDNIRRQIAALEADTRLSKEERTKALDLYRGELQTALAAGPPLPGNIELVTKNYGRMLEAVTGAQKD